MAGSANLIVDLGNGTVKFKSRDRKGKFKSTIERTDELYFILNLCAKFSLKSQPSIYGKYGKRIL